MLSLGMSFSVSNSQKTLAANTAATTSKVAQTGKSVDTSCHHLTARDLSYFSSEAFKAVLKAYEDKQLASKYGQLIARRKKAVNINLAWELVDAIIYVDIFDAHFDGFSFSYEEVRDLFKGYRSQALREMKSSIGFNSLVYKELAKALMDKSEVRNFLKAINAPILRSKPRF